MSRDQRPYAQWPKARSAIAASPSAYIALVVDADGDWAETDDPAVEPDGVYVIDADGDLSIDNDPAAIAALRARFVGRETVVY